MRLIMEGWREMVKAHRPKGTLGGREEVSYDRAGSIPAPSIPKKKEWS